MYKVIEQFSQGKHDTASCEDGLFISPAFAAVVDGSTSKGDYHWGKASSGRLARQVLIETLATLSPEADYKEAAHHFTQALRDYTLRHTHFTPEEMPAKDRLTASMVVYSDFRKEVWQIGDCPFLADGILHENSKPSEAILAAQRAAILKEALQKGMTAAQLQANDLGRKAILPLLRKQCEEQNKTFTVLDGTPVYERGIQVSHVGDCHELVLASDGYPQLLPTLQESEQALRNILTEDPLCIRTFKATKSVRPGNVSFDDRTYLRISLLS